MCGGPFANRVYDVEFSQTLDVYKKAFTSSGLAVFVSWRGWSMYDLDVPGFEFYGVKRTLWVLRA